MTLPVSEKAVLQKLKLEFNTKYKARTKNVNAFFFPEAILPIGSDTLIEDGIGVGFPINKGIYFICGENIRNKASEIEIISNLDIKISTNKKNSDKHDIFYSKLLKDTIDCLKNSSYNLNNKISGVMVSSFDDNSKISSSYFILSIVYAFIYYSKIKISKKELLDFAIKVIDNVNNNDESIAKISIALLGGEDRLNIFDNYSKNDFSIISENKNYDFSFALISIKNIKKDIKNIDAGKMIKDAAKEYKEYFSKELKPIKSIRDKNMKSIYECDIPDYYKRFEILSYYYNELSLIREYIDSYKNSNFVRMGDILNINTNKYFNIFEEEKKSFEYKLWNKLKDFIGIYGISYIKLQDNEILLYFQYNKEYLTDIKYYLERELSNLKDSENFTIEFYECKKSNGILLSN